MRQLKQSKGIKVDDRMVVTRGQGRGERDMGSGNKSEIGEEPQEGMGRGWVNAELIQRAKS